MDSECGAANLVHSWATDTDDPTEQPRWGKIGKQKIVDEGPLPPGPMPGIKYNMTTFDEVITQSTIDFMAKAANKPFFVWMNPTRAHVLTHLLPKYEAMRNPSTGWGEEEDNRVGQSHLLPKYEAMRNPSTGWGEEEDNRVGQSHLRRGAANRLRSCKEIRCPEAHRHGLRWSSNISRAAFPDGRQASAPAIRRPGRGMAP
jgi:hypothetical protein